MNIVLVSNQWDSVIMSDKNKEWSTFVENTYDVVYEDFGRGGSLDSAITSALGIAGDFRV